MNNTAVALAALALTVSTPALADPLPAAPLPNFFAWYQATGIGQLINQFGQPVEVWTVNNVRYHRWKMERFVQVDCEARLQVDQMLVATTLQGVILDRGHMTDIVFIPPEYGVIDAGCDK